MRQEKFEMINKDVFGSSHNLYIAITTSLSHKDLAESWRDIRNEVMTKWQDTITDDFSRWNFYLFYVVENLDKLDGSLRYQIEHDMVSSRKILVDRSYYNKDADLYETVVRKYINYDVTEGEEEDGDILPFGKSNEVVQLIKKIKDENQRNCY